MGTGQICFREQQKLRFACRFAWSLWTLGTEIFFLVLPVFEQQKPNRTESKPVGWNQVWFDFGFFLKKIGLVVFINKNRTEPKMITTLNHNTGPKRNIIIIIILILISITLIIIKITIFIMKIRIFLIYSL